MKKCPLILVTNDDGVRAQGIGELATLMMNLGEVIVVAPDAARSGSACAITPVAPVALQRLSTSPGLAVWSCSGTPVDCVKLGLEKALTRRPDLVVSGINHGDNASVSLHYSGTVGAIFEACMKDIPAVAFSLRTRERECDFSPYRKTITDVARSVLADGLPQGVCINVNFPVTARLQGASVCRMARGTWQQEWIPTEKEGEYTLAGFFTNLEPDARDTDYWALDHDMAAITPLQIDMTHYPSLSRRFTDDGR